MKRLIALALVLAAFATAAAAQTATGFTGKWQGTFTMQRPDGTEGNPNQVAFDLTQKGKALTGTAGPPEQQWPIDKGAVEGGKASFEGSSLQVHPGRRQGPLGRRNDRRTRGCRPRPRQSRGREGCSRQVVARIQRGGNV
jgi:hypothetical protein